MNQTIKKLAGIAAGLLLLGACTDTSSSPYTYTLTFQSSDLIFGYGSSTDQVLTMTTAPQMVLNRNLTDGTIQFVINSLYTPSGVISGQTEELQYGTTSFDENGRLIISLGSVSFGNYTLTDFNFLGFGNWMSLQFSYNGTDFVINCATTYSDQDTQADFVLWDADTEVTGTPYDPSGFETDNCRYGFSFTQSSGLCSLFIYNAQFASSMPETFILIPGLKFQMESDGYRVWSDGDIYPYSVTVSGSISYPEYVISNFEAFLPYNSTGGSLQFNCTTNYWLVEGNNMTISVLTSADDI